MKPKNINEDRNLEKQLLCFALKEPEHYWSFEPIQMSSTLNQAICREIFELKKANKTPTATEIAYNISVRHKKMNRTPEDIVKYINKLPEPEGTQEALENRLKELYLRRKLARMVHNALKVFEEDPNADFKSVSYLIESSCKNMLKESSLEEIKDIATLIEEDKKRSDRKIVSTGFSELDRSLSGGFKQGELCILAGRPSMGKTALALGMALQASKTNNVVFFSIEMSAISLIERLIGMVAKKSFNEMESDEINKAIRTLKDHKIVIDDSSSLAVQDIYIKLNQLNFKADLIFIDYLQLMRTRGTTENRNYEITRLSSELKALSKNLDVPVIALSQLSRATESRDSQKPRMSDLRDSGSLEQDADLILFPFRNNYYNFRQGPLIEAEIMIAKNRNGPIGTTSCKFYSQSMQFMEY